MLTQRTREKLGVFLSTLSVLASPAVFATDFSSYKGMAFPTYDSNKSKFVFQIGGFRAHQGEAQNIAIVDLIGDHFTVNQHNDNDLLLGLGYFINGYETNRVQFLYGLNAFALTDTKVRGNVIQEHLFTNLSYSYTVTHYPVYATIKAFIKNAIYNNDVTLDVGIGPNFMRTNDFTEVSLDKGVTIPDNIFTAGTNTRFSASAGVGIKFDHVLGNVPVEISYRYFYLGQGNLNKANNQVLNTLKTGTAYANALLLTLYV